MMPFSPLCFGEWCHYLFIHCTVYLHSLNIHIHCNTFTTISETTGDWICSSCALKCGIKTGIEGHEWKFSSSSPKSKGNGNGRGCVNDNDNNNESSEEHSEESIQQQHSKRIRTNPRPQLFFESESDFEDV